MFDLYGTRMILQKADDTPFTESEITFIKTALKQACEDEEFTDASGNTVNLNKLTQNHDGSNYLVEFTQYRFRESDDDDTRENQLDIIVSEKTHGERICNKFIAFLNNPSVTARVQNGLFI